jgi:plasmid stabilization system protein ParE
MLWCLLLRAPCHFQRIAPKAAADLRATLEHISDNETRLLQRSSPNVFTVIDRLAAGEFEGHQQRLTTGEVVRSWPVPPLRIYYQRRSDVLLVLRIYHQARRPITR